MAQFDPPVKALLFDVFGTCVDWRKTVTQALQGEARNALDSPSSSISSDVRVKASAMTYEQWGELAQDWRNTYLKFTRALASDPNIPYKTVDQHHLDALRELLTERELVLSQGDGSLWDEETIVKLSMVWHYLEPWSDTVEAIKHLNTKFSTCTLSNGNVALLEDMVRLGNMGFTHIFSAETFQSYKPNPKVYLGAAKKLGLEANECMMVAAHLDDLQNAKKYGLRTLYVERPREERYPELRDEDIPDLWVKEGEDGFMTAAERLGVKGTA